MNKEKKTGELVVMRSYLLQKAFVYNNKGKNFSVLEIVVWSTVTKTEIVPSKYGHKNTP